MGLVYEFTTMFDSLDSAKEELKRADHLFYVSLKYTRTVDVIKSVIERLINAYMFTIEAVLINQKEKGVIDDLPKIPKLRADLIKKEFSNDHFIQDAISFFLFLRKIDKANFTRKNEYRRHVTMTVLLGEHKVEIKIDTIKEYFEKAKEFVLYMENIINPDTRKD
jgi:hypothetical protein